MAALESSIIELGSTLIPQVVIRQLKGTLIAKAARKLVAKAGNIRTTVETYREYREGDKNHSVQQQIVSLGGPRLGEIDPYLHLDRVREENLSIVSNLLDSWNLRYWIFDRPWPRMPIINLLGDDFDVAMNKLASSSDLRGWYGRAIAPNGRSRGREFLLSANVKNVTYDAASIYRHVLASPDHTFKAGHQQGIRIVRWVEDPEGIDIVACAWNPISTVLPDPRSDGARFEEAYKEALELKGHTVTFPIDIVLTWVNGKDPVWLSKKNQALGEEPEENHVPDASDESRFESFDELRYCLRSIEQFAPWVRRIHIVTDQQVPDWLKVSGKINIVDHRDIWEDTSKLPVFNSHAIEANLHRIPGLTEHYLYMNDDFILGRPVSPDLFFHPGGVSKVFYSRALVEFGPIVPSDNVSTVAAKNARALLVRDGLPIMNRKFFHAPYALRRSVVEEIVDRFSEAVDNTSSSKFRSVHDVAVSGSLYFQYALATGRAVTGRIKYGYIDPADPKGMDRLGQIARRRNYDSVVINDGSQTVSEERREVIRRRLPAALDLIVPVKSEFEI